MDKRIKDSIEEPLFHYINKCDDCKKNKGRITYKGVVLCTSCFLKLHKAMEY